ncbi:MAG: hypothetical protein J6C46_11510 [Clostridia bacterium]|nr:hypothetical protein [Clostridia bacterium]
MENKDISRIVHNTLRRIDNYNLDIVRMKVKDIKYVLEYCVSLEKERDGIYSDYQDLGKEKLKLEEKVEHIRNRAFEEGNIAAKQLKEQEQIIKLMAEYMATHKYIGYDFEHAFPQEIIEEFKRKARGE